MECELTPKKNHKCMVVLLLICAIISFSFCGCDSQSGNYPFQKSEKWLCEDPQMSLEYVRNGQGYWKFSEVLIWDGETIKISINMHGNDYWVNPAESNHYDDRLFSGSWKYRNGNLVLIVEEDFIFDGKYSRIILKPIEGEPTQ